MNESAASADSTSAGRRLRLARESRGLSPQQAADLMRLPAGLVDAMEGDRFDALGAPVFARGHLRRYATLMNLPVEQLIEAYDRSQAQPSAPTLIPPASAHTPVRAEGSSGWPRSATKYLLAVLLLVAALAAAWWWWDSRETADDPGLVLPVPVEPEATAIEPEFNGVEQVPDVDEPLPEGAAPGTAEPAESP